MADILQNPTGKETIPMIASSYTLAAAFMSCIVMIIGMPLGRRRSIIIGNVLITIGGIIQAASYSVAQIVVARVLCVSHFMQRTLIQFANKVTGLWYCRESLPWISVMQDLTNGSFSHATFPCIW